MRFMIIRKADAETESETSPAGPQHAQLLKDMMAYNRTMLDAGIMRGAEGLKPSSAGARVQFKDGKPTVTDGPFAEAKELIAGFTLIEVKSKEEALEWVRRWPASDGHGNVSLELRRGVRGRTISAPRSRPSCARPKSACAPRSTGAPAARQSDERRTRDGVGDGDMTTFPCRPTTTSPPRRRASQGHAHRTPVLTLAHRRRRLGAQLFFKCENLQRMGAFKFRGAFNALSRFDAEQRQRRRRRLLLRQPRAGDRAVRPAARHAGHDRDAARRAGGEGRGDRGLRRRGRPLRPLHAKTARRSARRSPPSAA